MTAARRQQRQREPVPDRPAAEREVWAALRALVVGRNDRKREACETLGLSFVRIKALQAVVPAPMPMRDLAAALGTDAPYTTLVVDDLEARGLVARAPHPADRRVKLVGSTAAGRQAARRAESILGTPPPAMQRLSADELAELGRLVAALLD
jgi:DNA-binding MarR family transcriptional regulator